MVEREVKRVQQAGIQLGGLCQSISERCGFMALTIRCDPTTWDAPVQPLQ
jgi:hypothetical protein